MPTRRLIALFDGRLAAFNLSLVSIGCVAKGLHVELKQSDCGRNRASVEVVAIVMQLCGGGRRRCRGTKSQK